MFRNLVFSRVLLLLLTGLLASCSQLSKVNKENLGLRSPERKKEVFSVAWAKNLDPAYSTGNLPISSGTPLIYEGLVYMGSLDGSMRAYDLETGRLYWEAKDQQTLNTKASIFQDLLIYGSMEGRVYARHYLTGELKYSIDLGSSVEAAPVISAGRMFFHLRDHRIVSLDAATGKVFWSYKRSVPFTTTLQRVSSVLPYKNRLIVGFADGYLANISMEEGVVIWEQKMSSGVKFVDVDVDPIYYDGHIVAGSAAGDLKFVNPENGVIEKTIALRPAHSPLKVRENLLVGTTFGDIALIDKDGKILKRMSLSKDGVSSVQKWKDGFVVATMSSDIFYVDGSSLEVLSKFDLGHEQSAVFGHLQVKDSYLALFSSRNRLYVFK